MSAAVLGATDATYQRGKIQGEALYCKKHEGSLSLVRVNTFLPKDHARRKARMPSNRNAQIYRANRNGFAQDGLRRCMPPRASSRNVFASLMEAVKAHSLGQTSHALNEVGGNAGGICKFG